MKLLGQRAYFFKALNTFLKFSVKCVSEFILMAAVYKNAHFPTHLVASLPVPRSGKPGFRFHPRYPGHSLTSKAEFLPSPTGVSLPELPRELKSILPRGAFPDLMKQCLWKQFTYCSSLCLYQWQDSTHYSFLPHATYSSGSSFPDCAFIIRIS